MPLLTPKMPPLLAAPAPVMAPKLLTVPEVLKIRPAFVPVTDAPERNIVGVAGVGVGVGAITVGAVLIGGCASADHGDVVHR